MRAHLPKVPRSFADHADFQVILNVTLNEFQHDEKEAIIFFCTLGAEIEDISVVTQLEPAHIVSTLNLYAARLESKVNFFKKFMPYNEAELLQAGEYLFMEAPA